MCDICRRNGMIVGRCLNRALDLEDRIVSCLSYIHSLKESLLRQEVMFNNAIAEFKEFMNSHKDLRFPPRMLLSAMIDALMNNKDIDSPWFHSSSGPLTIRVYSPTGGVANVKTTRAFLYIMSPKAGLYLCNVVDYQFCVVVLPNDIHKALKSMFVVDYHDLFVVSISYNLYSGTYLKTKLVAHHEFNVKYLSWLQVTQQNHCATSMAQFLKVTQNG